jgi:hypothetical protein
MWWARLLNLIAAIHGVGTAASTNSYESIATVTLTGTQANISFTSIPSTYKHLQIRAWAKGDTAGDQDANIRFNSDTASNYSWHSVYGSGTSANATSGATTTRSVVGFNFAIGTGTTSIGSVLITDILDYTNTSKYKTIRTLSGADKNGTGNICLFSGLWQSTSAITSINIYPDSGNFTQYTQFALYGIKG